jgi:hypothetical protein
MVAATEIGHALPRDVPVPSVDDEPVVVRRVVAVAVSPMELFRPGSDLAQMIGDGGSVDLLLACEDAAAHDDDDEDDADDDHDDLRVAADGLGLADLHLHRLALPAPLSGAAESDLVAALSELVGFDPEPGVEVLAPLPLAGDPQRSVVDRAVREIVQVYGLPLRHYRCLELTVVDDLPEA